MSIDKNYFEKFIKTTEKAAIGAYPYIGKGDKEAADQGSVDMMRNELNLIDMNGVVVIGEGEMDEAPMLYIGEKVGTKKGQNLDIALDPLEGTNFVAKNLPNSFSMIAVCEKGNLFSAPDTYMEKIAIGKGLPKNLLDLDNSVEKNIKLLSEALEKKVDDNLGSIAFSIFPSEISDVMRVADNNLTMPPKSTWFDPKPLDGLVVYEFN